MPRRWKIPASADQPLRITARSATKSFQATAPILRGHLVSNGAVQFELIVGVDRLKTGNFLVEGAARAFLAAYRTRELTYRAVSDAAIEMHTHSVVVVGTAQAGQIEAELALDLTANSDWDSATRVSLVGRTSFRDVHIPLPGWGDAPELLLDVEADLPIQANT